MKNRAKRDVERDFGPIKEGLLTRLRAGRTPYQIAKEWDVHVNTIRIWMREEGIERRVIYATPDLETAGAVGG